MALVGQSLGEHQVVPVRRVVTDAALRRQPVQLERREERVQQRRMMRVATVLDIQLPVVRHDVVVAADDLHRPATDGAPDMRDHRLAQVLLQRRGLVAESAEHQALDHLDAQPGERMPRLVEALRHAAKAADALLERDAAQFARLVERPCMVRADEAALALAARVVAEYRTLVRATVDQRVDAALRGAHDDHRGVADLGQHVVVRLRDFAFERQEVPRRSAEDAVLLPGVDLGVAVDVQRYPRQVVGGPPDELADGTHPYRLGHCSAPCCSVT